MYVLQAAAYVSTVILAAVAAAELVLNLWRVKRPKEKTKRPRK